jgi:peroxiredoxin
MNSKRLFHYVVAAVALALVTALLGWPARGTADTTTANLRKTAPDFTLPDSSGVSIKLSNDKGQIVLLDFWATWCHGCGIEIPWYKEFANRYKGQGLTVIGVSMDEDGWKSVQPFLKENKLNYPVVIGDKDLAKQYGVDSMPVTLLIDRDGKIAESHTGMVDKTAFEQDIQLLLHENLGDAHK